MRALCQSRRVFALVLLAGAFLSTSPALAFTAGRPTGIMITVNSIDSATATVDLDITMTTTGTSPIGTIGSPVGFFGNLWSFQYTLFGGTVTNRYIWQNPSAPAIDFGDGNTLANTTLSLVAPGPPNVYSGNFMHTYPGPGTYDLRAGVCRFIGPIATVTPPPAGQGNLITLGTATTITFQLYYLPTFTTPNTVVANFVTPFVAGMTNGVNPQPGGGFGGIVIFQNLTDVPTLGEWSLGLLALLLGSFGVYFLRR